jgi:hypothetical protein
MRRKGRGDWRRWNFWTNRSRCGLCRLTGRSRNRADESKAQKEKPPESALAHPFHDGQMLEHFSSTCLFRKHMIQLFFAESLDSRTLGWPEIRA